MFLKGIKDGLLENIIQEVRKARIRRRQNQIEAAVQRCSVKKRFLEISQTLQEKTLARVSFLVKLQVW